MMLVIVALADAVGRVAMPALAGLLIVVGFGTVKPMKIWAVARTGSVSLAVMAITFTLTLVIPVQYAVLVGVGISVLLFVIGQSSRLVLRRIELVDDGRIREVDPPAELSAHDVVIVQPYGAIFFATASVLHEQMPDVTPDSVGSVVILRVRGVREAGATMLEVLRSYARSLADVGSKLIVVTDNSSLLDQLEDTGTADVIGHDNVYRGTEYLGETLRRAHDDAWAWVAARSDADAAGEATP
jgi:SulP family sulfate permease